MHTVIIRDTQFNVSTVELERLLQTSYYNRFKTHSNGSQRQIDIKGIDTFSIVTPHCLDMAMELVKQYCHPFLKAGN